MRFFNTCLGLISQKMLASWLYYLHFHKRLNWKSPRNINEKINWLKFYSDTSQWSLLADKYKVRDYISDKGLGYLLVDLYGHWESPELIDFDKLPDKFVLKANNGCGDVLICDDKSKLDKKDIIKKYDKILHRRFGLNSSQPHYLSIKPCLICEELLDISTQPNGSRSLIDYKFFCFDGRPMFVLVCSDRDKETHRYGREMFDMLWNDRSDFILYSSSFYVKPSLPTPKPLSFDTMFKAASVLSKGFPFVRVDLYDVNGYAYFGELTFTPQQGYMSDYSDDFLMLLGEHCHI